MRKILATLAAAVAVVAVAATPASAAQTDGPDIIGYQRLVPGTVYITQLAPNAYTQMITQQAPNSIYWSHLNNNIVSVSKLAPDARAAIELGTTQAGTIPAPVTVKNVGGTVYGPDRATPIPVSGITLQPGCSYLITYSGQVEANTPAAANAPVVRAQIFPWLNTNADDSFDKAEEIKGAISAAAEVPPVADRHATMTGQVRYDVPADAEPVALQLGAHAYADDASQARKGTFAITAATISAELIG